MRWALCLLAIAPHHLSACSCLVKLSLCQEVAASSVVFVGKVESVYPFYLDSANRRKAVEFQDEVSRLHSGPSPEAVERLRAVYSNMLFDKILAQGKQVRLSVRRKFNEAADDDQPYDAGSTAPSEKIVV